MSSPDHIRTCPKCGAQVPIYYGFPSWCSECEWNLQEEKPELPTGVFEKLWLWLGKRSGNWLLKEAIAQTDLRPRLTISVILAYGIALVVHAFTLALFASGIYLGGFAVISWGRQPNFMVAASFLGMILCLFLVYKTFPRSRDIGKHTLNRQQAPALYRLLDVLSEKLNAPQVETVVIINELNASSSLRGFRRKFVLGIGLPMPLTLEAQEFVAVLGHEVAHARNGDATRSKWITMAVATLAAWHEIFRLDEPLAFHSGGFAGLLALMIDIVFRVLASGFWLLAFLLILLLFRTKQRAEFIADGLSAKIAGTKAAKTSLKKSYLNEAYSNIFKLLYHTPDTKYLTELHRLENIPEREMQRIDRLLKDDESRLDVTHPPTKHRLAYLDGRPMEAGQVGLSAAQYDQIRAEIGMLEEPIAQEIEQQLANRRKMA